MKRHRIDYEALDKQYLWHPFTQMRDWMDSPQLVIERGQGVYLFDTEGNRYLDGVSSLWASIHGHRHPHRDGDGAVMEERGKANPTIATNWISKHFECLALTIEMPFKDNANLPDLTVGWNGERSKRLGASVLQPLLAVL